MSIPHDAARSDVDLSPIEYGETDETKHDIGLKAAMTEGDGRWN